MRAKWRVPLIVFVSVTGAFWLIALPLLLLGWRSSVDAERARNAPECTESQVFSKTYCSITLPGTITKITSSELVVTVAGRSISSAVTLAGNLPHTPHGIPAQVTIYRGKVIHVENETPLFVDTNAAPSTKAVNYSAYGAFFLVGGLLLGGYSTAKTIETRNQPPSVP
jgi:hypothetical protein